MRNIVVPTDFSENAKIALNYAINIANQFGSTIHLVNGIDNISGSTVYTDVSKMLQETAMRKLTTIVNEVAKSLDHLVLMIPKTLRGETSTAICEYAELVDADLIIMGTQGASGLKEIFIGTVAQGVIKNAKPAVLVIPAAVKFKPPKNISLALDEHEISSEEVILPFKNIAKAFNSKVTIFHFNEEFDTTNIDPSIETYMSDVDFSIHDQYSDDKNINKVISEYVQEEGVELMAMIRRKRSFIASLFHKSITTKEVFNSNIPLLILHDKL